MTTFNWYSKEFGGIRINLIAYSKPVHWNLKIQPQVLITAYFCSNSVAQNDVKMQLKPVPFKY